MNDAVPLSRAKKSTDVLARNSGKSNFVYEKLDQRYSFARFTLERSYPYLLAFGFLISMMTMSRTTGPWLELLAMFLGIVPLFALIHGGIRRSLWCGRIGVDAAGLRFSESILGLPGPTREYRWSEISEVSVSQGPFSWRHGSVGHVLSFHLRGGTRRDIALVALHPHELKDLGAALQAHAPHEKRDELTGVVARACCIRDAQLQQGAAYVRGLWDSQNLPAQRTASAFKPFFPGDVVADLPVRITVNKLISCGGLCARYEVNFAAPDESDGGTEKHGLLLQLILPSVHGGLVDIPDAARLRAQAFAQVDQPMLAKPVRVFCADGSLFVLYDYIAGKDLRSYMRQRRRRLPLPEVMAYVRQILQVVAAVHGQSIVFGDLSPESIVVTKSGEIMILPISGFQAGAAELKNFFLGKSAYVAREQLADGPSERNDLYSLAAVVHFALTGCDPDTQGPLHPSIMRPQTPAFLDAAIAQATAASAAQRFATVSLFEEALKGGEQCRELQ